MIMLPTNISLLKKRKKSELELWIGEISNVLMLPTFFDVDFSTSWFNLEGKYWILKSQNLRHYRIYHDRYEDLKVEVKIVLEKHNIPNFNFKICEMFNLSIPWISLLNLKRKFQTFNCSISLCDIASVIQIEIDNNQK